MNRLVVFGEAGAQSQWLHRLLSSLQPAPRYSQRLDGSADCDGLLVIDDGGAAGARALRSALALRGDRKNVPLAIVRSIDESWTEEEALTRGLLECEVPVAPRISEARLKAAVSLPPNDFEVRISPTAIQFEYSGE